MKNTVPHSRESLRKHRGFFRFFIPLFLFITLLFIVFAVFTYQRSRRIMERELINASEQDLSGVAESIDQLVSDTKYIIATLVTNRTMQFFYSTNAPELLWEDYEAQLQAQLSVLRYSQEAIDDIYLYSDASQSVYSSSQHCYISGFADRFWLEQLQPDQSGFSVFPYAMKQKFPYVICVVKSFQAGGHHCAVAIMLDLSKVANLRAIGENAYQNAYLLSDSGDILYRYQQEALIERAADDPTLSLFSLHAGQPAPISRIGGNMYAFSQRRSAEADWSYILVTHLTTYSQTLSSQRAVFFAVCFSLLLLALCFALFFALRSVKPIRVLREYLDSPEVSSAASTDDNEDVKYIAARITQYVQSNHHLREELQDRLALLNESQILALQSQINPHFLSNTLSLMYAEATDELGYDHPLPLMILDTSSLIRYAIEPEKMVTLETELANTDVYLSILKHRYNRELAIRHDVAPETLRARVPRLFIQPIIENAVFHGFSGSERADCVLTISCHVQSAPGDAPPRLVVCIRDNGYGIDALTPSVLRESLRTPDAGRSKSVGLRNVIQRMRLIYADRFSYEIESAPDAGTSFVSYIPYIE